MAGHLALILHAHLPFVRHPEHEHFLEEDWLFEAITETYIPLLQMMQRLGNDNVPFKLTMSLTPTLCAMLQDELLCERYIRHLDRSITLAEREIERHREDETMRGLAAFYHHHFLESRHKFSQWDADLISVFRRMRDDGCLELMASAATHGLLPLLEQAPEAVRAQVLLGCDSYREIFQADPAGFWLPECAYRPRYEWTPPAGQNRSDRRLRPGIEELLAEYGIEYFVADAHLVWFMDEVDKLFAAPFASDFFGLVRSWHNARSTEADGPWRKLTVVISLLVC